MSQAALTADNRVLPADRLRHPPPVGRAGRPAAAAAPARRSSPAPGGLSARGPEWPVEACSRVKRPRKSVARQGALGGIARRGQWSAASSVWFWVTGGPPHPALAASNRGPQYPQFQAWW
jgi:hypothetical protein